MANNVVINVSVQNNTTRGFASINASLQGLTQNAGQATSAMGTGGASGGGLSGALGGVGAVIGMSALPAIGALSPMLFGLAAVGGAAALAMGDIKEEAKKLKPEFEALQQTASKAVMPGIRDAMADLKVAMKELHPVIKVGGEAFGEAAREAGKFAKSPAFQDALLKNVQLGSQWFKEFSSSILKFTQSFLEFGAKSKPTLDALGGGLNSILGQGLPSMFAGLEKGIGGSAKMFDGLFEAVNRTLGALGRLSGTVGNAFGGFLGSVFRKVGELAECIELLLTPAIDALAPVFESVSGTMSKTDGMAKGLARVLGEVLGGAAKVLAVPLKNLFDFMTIMIPIAKDLAVAIAGPLFSAFTSVTGADEGMKDMSNSLTDWSNWVADHKEEITAFFTGVSAAILEMVTFALDQIPMLYNIWSTTVKAMLGVLDVFISSALEGFSLIPGPIGDAAEEAGKSWDDFSKGITDSLDEAGQSIQDMHDEYMPMLENNQLKLDISHLDAQLAVARKELKNTTDPRYEAELKAEISQLLKEKARAQRAIDSLQGKSVDVTVNTHLRTYQYAAVSAGTARSGLAHGGIVGSFSRAATGGIRSNRVLVGEQGPEIVDLAPGSRVRPAGETARMMRSQAGAGGSAQPMNITLMIGNRSLGEILIDPIRNAVRTRGGDVQAVLGR